MLPRSDIAIDILVMWFFFAAAARSFQRFTRDARGQRILNRTFGVLFVTMGAALLSRYSAKTSPTVVSLRRPMKTL